MAISGVLGSRKITVPGWLDVTSVPLLYGALYTFFDKFAWRWRIFRRLGVVEVPVLAGRWKGYILSSHDEFKTRHAVNIQIEQNWTRMRITAQGEFSRSHSILAAVFVNADEGRVLDYEYRNEPLAGAKDAMQIHYGTARLNLASESILDGFYYTGRGRQNNGHVHLVRS